MYIYGGASGAFTLYEDENTNYNYEKGAFSTIQFNYDNEEGELTIGDRQGEFPGMLRERTFEIVWVDASTARGLDFNLKPDKILRYEGRRITIKK